MLSLFQVAAHEKRLIPEARLTGPMPWIVAIMIFLTILAAATGLAFVEAGNSLNERLASKLVVQIVDANPDRREEQAKAASSRLEEMQNVTTVRTVPADEVEDLVRPWLGEGSLGDDIPLPALIEAELDKAPSDSAFDRMQQDIKAVAPAAEMESSASFVDPVTDLMGSLQWIAFALVLLLGFATAAAVIISARAALNTHRETIDIVHHLGGTDNQIIRLIQRRIALDALLGGLLGLLAGIILIWLIAGQMKALQSAMVDSLGLSWWSWLIIVLIPILGMLLAMVTARLTVRRSLEKIL